MTLTLRLRRSPSPPSSPVHGKHRSTLQPLFHLFRFSLSSRASRLLLLSLVLTAATAELCVFYSGKLPSEFYAVLTSSSVHATFPPLIAKSIAIILATALSQALLQYIGGLLETYTRRDLTRYLHAIYLNPIHFLALSTSAWIDHPDQRISQDIDKFTSTSRTILQQLCMTPFLIPYYAYQCYTVSGYLGPVSILAYFLLSTLLARFLSPPLSRAIYAKEREEGLFRQLHQHTLLHHESIAFLAGEPYQHHLLNTALAALIQRQSQTIHRSFPLQLLSQSVSYFGSILNYLIIAIPILNGTLAHDNPSDLASTISLYSFVAMYLIYKFTSILDQITLFSSLLGYTRRISDIVSFSSSSSSSSSSLDPVKEHALVEDNVEATGIGVCFHLDQLSTPTHLLLLQGISFFLSLFLYISIYC